MTIYLFAARDDRNGTWETCQALKKEFPQIILINRMCTNLDDLMKVAKHKIVSSPTLLVLGKSDKPVTRLTDITLFRDALKGS